jgi:hypothetical protein
MLVQSSSSKITENHRQSIFKDEKRKKDVERAKLKKEQDDAADRAKRK